MLDKQLQDTIYHSLNTNQASSLSESAFFRRVKVLNILTAAAFIVLSIRIAGRSLLTTITLGLLACLLLLLAVRTVPLGLGLEEGE